MTSRPNIATIEVMANATHHQRGRWILDDAGDALGDPAEIPLVQDKRDARQRLLTEADASLSITSGAVVAPSMPSNDVIPSRADARDLAIAIDDS